jgi:ATP-dependent DNA helicase RecG
MDIIESLQKPEGKTLEFKRDLSSPDSILRTLIAFANTAGGLLIIGVEDQSKHVSGIMDPFKMEEKLANLVSDSIAPQLLPDISVIPWRNTYLLIANIFPSQAKPHYLKKFGLEKGAYIRVGSTNRLADQTMIAELQRIKMEDPYDKQPIATLDSEALDFQVAAELFAPVKALTRGDLTSLDLITLYQDKKVPTIAGVILFGKERLKFFPDAWIQVGRFSGTTKTTIRDTQEIKIYPILAIDEALNFVKKHAEMGIEIQGARNTKKWSLPLGAVREALINAVVHADYSQQGAPIRLAIFDDRIEIENPGLLLPTLTIDEIKRGISKLRNRAIGQVFHRLGLIERWGSGIGRIIDLCKERGFAEPIFEEIGSHFRVTIFTQIVQIPYLDSVEQEILAILKDHKDGLSTNDIAAMMQKSVRTLRSRLSKLVEKGSVIGLGKSANDPKRKYYLKD